MDLETLMASDKQFMSSLASATHSTKGAAKLKPQLCTKKRRRSRDPVTPAWPLLPPFATYVPPELSSAHMTRPTAPLSSWPPAPAAGHNKPVCMAALAAAVLAAAASVTSATLAAPEPAPVSPLVCNPPAPPHYVQPKSIESVVLQPPSVD